MRNKTIPFNSLVDAAPLMTKDGTAIRNSFAFDKIEQFQTNKNSVKFNL
jgi:hypothetical protein